ncbi:hypothetical protein [Amphibacillus cookii]|uniref:hypothetical protein n=1 Tax=Amphibacillus cookii TaxID=767787 RepID=UPI00195B0DA5|nr:hypothetical protein [Amphibacillus cookii]MBM7542800.1 hypothetical protein [Amphibacillus cookii]
MVGEDDYNLNEQKVKFLTGIGCFWVIVILVLMVVSVPVWLYFSYSEETQLLVSHSPNNIKTIEIVRIEDFPDPTLRINYDNKSIMKTKLPDNISVEWENDYEANVILTRQKREPDIVKIEFNN